MLRTYILNPNYTQPDQLVLIPGSLENAQTLYIGDKLFNKLYSADAETVSTVLTTLKSYSIDKSAVQFVNIGTDNNMSLEYSPQDFKPQLSLKKKMKLGGNI